VFWRALERQHTSSASLWPRGADLINYPDQPNLLLNCKYCHFGKNPFSNRAVVSINQLPCSVDSSSKLSHRARPILSHLFVEEFGYSDVDKSTGISAS
jgi:hypothetical protein